MNMNLLKFIGERIGIIVLTIIVAFTFMPTQVDAASKLGTPKNLKAVPQITSVALSWDKVKGARSYKIYQQKTAWSPWKKTTKKKYADYKKSPKRYRVKKSGKKYYYKKYGNVFKPVKTVKTNKASINKLKANTFYKFKVRASKGKKIGKYSKAKTIKTKQKYVSSDQLKNQRDKTPGDGTGDNQNPGENINKEYPNNPAIYTVLGPEMVYKGDVVELKVNAPINSVEKLEWYISNDEFEKTERGLSLKVKIPVKTNRSYLHIKLTNRDSNEKYIWSTDYKTIRIEANPNKVGTYWECDMSRALPKRDYNTLTTGKKDANGISTITLDFISDGGVNWVKENYHIAVEDVTPNAYKRVFRQLGCEEKLTKNIEYEDYNLYEYDGYGRRHYTGESGTKITITLTVDPGVQAVKLYDASGKIIDRSKTYDYTYLYTTYYIFPKEVENDSYYQYDLDLYKKLRNKIEAKLWTSGMNTKDKLSAVANYICSTTHYPSEIIKKENNPEFWNDWAVDDVDLLYNMSNRALLNSMMKWQGGITTCQAAAVMERVAEEDLGLKYIYSSAEGIANEEGFYRGVGRGSSNPSNPLHETFYYKDGPDGTTWSYDVQGMTGDSATYKCSEHNCKSRLIDIN